MPTLRLALPVFRDPAVPSPPEGTDWCGARIAVVTLGCDKNTVDTERILARLAAAGAQMEADVAQAEVVLVNTCGFIDAAKEESVIALLEAVRLKQEGGPRAVVAMGCLVQRYGDELRREIPEVDLFVGLTEIERLVPELRARGLLPAEPPTMERPLLRVATHRTHTSYLKISEGCDHSCAFCAIPLMRGKHRSLPIDELVREAQELEAAGVVELNLVSQDTTWYGRDVVRSGRYAVTDGFIGRPFAGMANAPPTAGEAAIETASRTGLLPELLRSLLTGTAIPWIRMFYLYPSGIRPELIELMAQEPRLLPYLDMPIQHGSDRILEAMRRPERRATILDRTARLRAALPDVTLRTTVIVGFPGETDDDFDALLELLEEVKFDRVGAFAYSVEENTRAATLPERVAPGEIRERLERLQDVQRGITLERNERWLGRAVDVLVDRATGRTSMLAGHAAGATARTSGQAIEIDGVVHLANAAVEAGQIVRARITEALEDDLIGELVDG